MEAQMLVLSRKVGQSIQIGDNVAVTILRISASEIRIGIEAPADVTILRQELASPVKATLPVKLSA